MTPDVATADRQLAPNRRAIANRTARAAFRRPLGEWALQRSPWPSLHLRHRHRHRPRRELHLRRLDLRLRRQRRLFLLLFLLFILFFIPSVFGMTRPSSSSASSPPLNATARGRSPDYGIIRSLIAPRSPRRSRHSKARAFIASGSGALLQCIWRAKVMYPASCAGVSRSIASSSVSQIATVCVSRSLTSARPRRPRRTRAARGPRRRGASSSARRAGPGSDGRARTSSPAARRTRRRPTRARRREGGGEGSGLCFAPERGSELASRARASPLPPLTCVYSSSESFTIEPCSSRAPQPACAHADSSGTRSSVYRRRSSVASAAIAPGDLARKIAMSASPQPGTPVRGQGKTARARAARAADRPARQAVVDAPRRARDAHAGHRRDGRRLARVARAGGLGRDPRPRRRRGRAGVGGRLRARELAPHLAARAAHAAQHATTLLRRAGGGLGLGAHRTGGGGGSAAPAVDDGAGAGAGRGGGGARTTSRRSRAARSFRRLASSGGVSLLVSWPSTETRISPTPSLPSSGEPCVMIETRAPPSSAMANVNPRRPAGASDETLL